MTYESFVNAIGETLKIRLGDGWQIQRKCIQKNNGVKHDCLIVRHKEHKAGPVLYLEGLYQKFCAGWSVTELCEEIESGLTENPENAAEELIEELFHYSRIKERIVFRLVHAKRNQERLRETAHVPFLDLAVEFVIVGRILDAEIRYISLPRTLMEKWGVSTEELYRQALENAKKRFPEELMGLEEMVYRMTNGKKGSDSSPSLPIYVLTNKRRCYGAGCILYPEVLKKFSDKFGKDVLILPGSIHETLLIPDFSGSSVEALEEIVRSVNQTEVLPEDILSEKVYRYSRETGRIEFADNSYVYEEAV